MTTKHLSGSPADIEEAGRILRNGGLCVIPTETVYGLAANAFDQQAVLNVFKAKGRPADNPLIVHISELSQLERVVSSVPDDAIELAKKYWPGPLTMIMPKHPDIAPAVTPGMDTVGVRMPSHPIARAIIDAAGVPLAAPSTNISGRPSPTCLRHVIEDMEGRVDAIVDGGECAVGVESTVVSLCARRPHLFRPGAVTPEMISKVLGEVEIDKCIDGEVGEGVIPASPGMKYKHYAPAAEITVCVGSFEKFAERCSLLAKTPGVFALCFEGEGEKLPVPSVEYGAENDSAAQCRRIFTALRELDEKGAKKVLARCPSRENEGLAVYNRLARAAGHRFIWL